MTWEVITFGNGQLIVNILNGLKLLMQGPWNSLMMLVALGAVAIAVFRLAFPDKNDFNPVAGFVRTLAIIMVVFAITMRITVNVGVTDVLNPTSPQEVVTGVPIAVAFPMYVQSTVSYELTTMVEAAFSLPAGASMQYGLMRHHLELQSLLNAQLPVGDTRATLTAYMLECIFPNVSDPTGLLDQNTLMDTTDLLGQLQVNEQVRGSNVFQGGKLVDNITCADAYNNAPGKDVMSLLGSTTPLPDYKRVLQEITMSFGADDTDGMVAEIDQVVNSLLGVTGGGAGLSALNTILLRDIWNAATAEEANKDQNVVTAVNNMLDVLRRELNFQSYGQAWTISKWVPMVRAIGEGLVYMTAPLVLLMIMSRAGMATLGTYAKAFVWLALWGPLFAILNDFMYLYASQQLHLLTLCPTDMPAWVQTRIATIAAGSPQCTGITLRNYDQIRDTILAINTAGLGLVNAVPILAGALVYMGGNLASSALEHAGQPDTSGLAKTTAAGKMEKVQYEGGGQLVTWAQADGLTTTANYGRGVQYKQRGDGSREYSGLEGSYRTDAFGSVIDGSRVVQKDGATIQTTGHGSIEEVTTTRGSERITDRFNTAGGQRRMIGRETFTITPEGFTQEGSFNGEGRGTIQEKGVDQATRMHVERKLNQDRIGTESRNGVATLPVKTKDGVQQVQGMFAVEGAYNQGTFTPKLMSMQMNDASGTHVRHGRWNAEAQAFEWVAGETKNTVSDVRATRGPDGKLALTETQLAPDGAMLTKQYRAGESAEDSSFHTHIDGRHYQGKNVTFVADDGSKIGMFTGQVTDGTTKHSATAMLRGTDKDGWTKATHIDGKAGSAFEIQDKHNVTKERLNQDRAGKVRERMDIDNVTKERLNQDRAGNVRERLDVDKTRRDHVNEDRAGRVKERLDTETYDSRTQNLKGIRQEDFDHFVVPQVWTDQTTGKQSLVLADETRDRQTGQLLTGTYTNTQEGKVWKAWQDDKTKEMHYGVGQVARDPATGQWRTLNLQETGQLAIDRDGYATRVTLGARGEELHSESKQGQEVWKGATYNLDYSAEAKLTAGSVWVQAVRAGGTGSLTRDAGPGTDAALLGIGGLEAASNTINKVAKTKDSIGKLMSGKQGADPGKGSASGGGRPTGPPSLPTPPTPSQRGTVSSAPRIQTPTIKESTIEEPHIQSPTTGPRP